MNRCSLRHNRALNKGSQYGSRCAGNHGQTNATGRTAAALDRDGYSDLARSTPVPSLAIAADVGFVGLDIALQEWRGKGRKTRSKLVQQRPRRLLAPQPRVFLKLKRRKALLVTSQEEDAQKPDAKRDTGSVKDGSRGD